MKIKQILFTLIITIGTLTLATCDYFGTIIGTVNCNVTGYAKGNASRSMAASRAVSSTENIYNSRDFSSFLIAEGEGDSIRNIEITKKALLLFEREVPGYDDNPASFQGYYNHFNTYPSNAVRTGDEGLYLVFDSRKPDKRYQVDRGFINENNNLEEIKNQVEPDIALGKTISIFHVDGRHLTCFWAIYWLSEDDGGVPGDIHL
jgi:hypothetical protein